MDPHELTQVLKTCMVPDEQIVNAILAWTLEGLKHNPDDFSAAFDDLPGDNDCYVERAYQIMQKAREQNTQEQQK